MPDQPTAYLVLASQRSGSTLLVESLRATGVAGEPPQEFFQYLPSTSMSPQPPRMVLRDRRPIDSAAARSTDRGQARPGPPRGDLA